MIIIKDGVIWTFNKELRWVVEEIVIG